MTRLRQQMNALDNVIRDERFNADRNRRAMIDREYASFMREVKASYPEQLEVTRGPDPIAEDMRWLKNGLWLGLLVGLAMVAVRYAPSVWAWAEVTL